MSSTLADMQASLVDSKSQAEILEQTLKALDEIVRSNNLTIQVAVTTQELGLISLNAGSSNPKRKYGNVSSGSDTSSSSEPDSYSELDREFDLAEANRIASYTPQELALHQRFERVESEKFERLNGKKPRVGAK